MIKSPLYTHTSKVAVIMSRQDQVLEIEPPIELTFMGKRRREIRLIDATRSLLVFLLGPFTSAVSSVMKLGNPSDKKVCFKIKTTAPKRYCVKPNSGVIDPKQTVTISGRRIERRHRDIQ